MRSLRNHSEATVYACYVGYITQAIVNAFAPLLFVTFQIQYGIGLPRITFLTSLNFGIQLLVDFASAVLVDRIGYRVSVVAAHLFAAAGLLGLAVLPEALPVPYGGIVIAVALYAVGGGLIEVLVSPIVEAAPAKNKSAAMSLLHSFYCWGVVGVVLLSTLFFSTAGIRRWPVLAALWALIPLLNSLLFSVVPIYSPAENRETMPVASLFSRPVFYLLLLFMLCAGASEQAMSQWASAFAEQGLGIGKTYGDLAGPCFFAVLMGSARVFYAKRSRLPIREYMMFCCLLCLAGYAAAGTAPAAGWSLLGCAVTGFSVGVMWPGVISMAAQEMRGGTTAMYALLALAGDLGCVSGPAVVGIFASLAGDSLKAGLCAAMVFPAILLVGLWRLREGREGRP